MSVHSKHTRVSVCRNNLFLFPPTQTGKKTTQLLPIHTNIQNQTTSYIHCTHTSFSQLKLHSHVCFLVGAKLHGRYVLVALQHNHLHYIVGTLGAAKL